MHAQEKIRNFCIIAHIDHGKSTLADRFLEVTGTISKREMKEQVLDQMNIERERGITIKLQPARMEWHGYELNLIDTPGHVDFTYEVSRSLAAVEGAVLLVDATQGVQAQTVANLYLALEQDLAIIPVINKIDLPNAEVERVRQEICSLLGCRPEEVLSVSGKTGQGVEQLLDSIIERVPAAKGQASAPTRALIFDSKFDEYRGVVAYVRVVDGTLAAGQKLHFISTDAHSEALEVGVLTPKFIKQPVLQAGEIGYLVTGMKEIAACRVGDTITVGQQDVTPLPGYREVKPMVFAGIFCKEGSDYPRLRDGIEKLKLNDAALSYEPESTQALGFGFRCGFLGLLHLEVIQERLQREYNLELVVTVPSVAYNVQTTDGQNVTVRSPHELPRSEMIVQVTEPVMRLDIFTPKQYVGPVMQLVSERRAVYKTTEYLDERIAVLHYDVPLTALLVDFYDRIKSASSGYASINYELLEYRPTDIVRLDVLVADESVEALASLVYRDSTFRVGKEIVSTLKETMPRQQFMLKLQAAVGGKIIAAERLSALRKDVTENLYGGDYTRKRKVLEKQKRGKKRMLSHGRVDIPPEAFLAVLKREKN